MLVLRFHRIGKKHHPAFRLAVAERRSKLQAPPTEDLGWYSPITKKHELKKERIMHWLKVGAKPSPTVHNLLISAGIIEGKKIPVHKVIAKNAKEDINNADKEKKIEEVKIAEVKP